MKTHLKLVVFILILIFLLSNCQRDFSPLSLITTIQPKDSLKFEDGLTYLGLSGSYINKIRIYNNQLYACAGSAGLYKMDLVYAPAEFQYLGLKDTSIYQGAGSYDVWVSNDDQVLITTFNTRTGIDHVLYRSTDCGNTWTYNDSAMFWQHIGFYGYYYVRFFANFSSNKILVFGEKAYKTTTKGEIWEETSGGVPFLRIVVVHPVHKTIWIGGRSHFESPVLSYSENEGETWNGIQIGSIVGNASPVVDIALHPTDPNIAYVIASNKIIKTQDKGNSWEIIYANSFFQDIEIDPDSALHFYGREKNSIQESFDGGFSWNYLSGIDDQTATMLYNKERKLLFIGTDNGIYVYKP